MEKRVVVIVSCHFEKWNKLCKTTIARIDRAVWISRPETQSLRQTRFVPTGNVPCYRGSYKLSALIKRELLNRGARSRNILAGKGVGIFSESRAVPRQIKERWPDTEVMEIVSSDWYFWPAKPLWQKFGKEHGLQIEIVPVEFTGGWRTKCFYLIYGAVVRISLSLDSILHLGFSLLAENILTKSQENRKKGFTWNGCA